MSDTPEQDESITLRTSILKDVFHNLDKNDAVALVGILFEYRVRISKKFSTFIKQHNTTFTLEPLEPSEAASIVANLFGLDCDRVFLEFQQGWHDMRKSPRTKGLIADIALHDLVDQLEECSPLQ